MAVYPLVLAKGPTSGVAVSVPAHPGKGVFFGNGDKLDISLDSSFSTNAAIMSIAFFASENEANAFASATQGDLNKTISYGSGSAAIDLFTSSISIPGGGIGAKANIKDIEATEPDNQHIWYAVTIVDGGVTWTYDPELINTGTTDSRRGFNELGEGDTSTTLGGATVRVVARNAAARPRAST